MNLSWTDNSSKTLASEVADAYSNMEKAIQYQLENKKEVSISSNPYDYIIENEYYENLDSKIKKQVEVYFPELKLQKIDDNEIKK